MTTSETIDSSKVAAWVQAENAAIEPLSKAHNTAYWQLNVTGESKFEKESAKYRALICRRYSDPGRFQEVRAFDRASGSLDPQLARQVHLFYLQYLGNQSKPEVLDEIVRREMALEADFNRFRAKIDGMEVTDNQLKKILQDENNSERRQAAWEASKQVGAQVAGDVRELARMRNAEARQLGFRDHFAMSLEMQELDEKRLFETFERLTELSEEPYSDYKKQLDRGLATRFGVGPDKLMPWHYSDPFFQEAPAQDLSLDSWFAGKQLEPLSSAHYRGMGLEVDDIIARSDLYEKPGKCQHAFCMSIDRRDDVRMLCNIVANERWMETLLHELGHAVYDKYLDPALPFVLRQAAHTLSTESIAMINGRFPRDPHWLQRFAGVPPTEAQALGKKLRVRLGEGLMILTRWVQVMTHFERDLYADPDGDLNSKWWDHVERLQKMRRPPGRNQPDWAAKIHVALAPVYYQNYLLGEMMASQLDSYIQREVVGTPGAGLGALVDRPEVGSYLKSKIFEPGALRPWEEGLRHATGEGLNPEHFVAQYRG